MTVRGPLDLHAAEARLTRQEVQLTRSHVAQIDKSLTRLLAENVELRLENNRLKEQLSPVSEASPST